MRITRDRMYKVLLRYFADSLERIVGRSVRALCYASGKETGRKLANGFKTEEITDAVNIISNMFSSELKLKTTDNNEILIEQSPLLEIKDEIGDYISSLVFFNDGLIAGLLEEMLNTRLELVPVYDDESNIARRKLIIYEEKHKVSAEVI